MDRSAASLEVELIARRRGVRPFARTLGVNEASVRLWISGKNKPKPALRKKIAGVYPTVLEAAWDTAPPKTPKLRNGAALPPPARSAVTKPRASDDEGPIDAAEEAARNVRRLRSQLELLHADPHATSKEKSQTSAALTSATRLLLKANGSADLTASQVIRSAQFRSVLDTMVEALRPFPEARAALVEALRQRGDT